MTSTTEHLTASGTRLARTPRNVGQAIWCGLRGKCPNCGTGNLFRKYLKVADTCGHCGEALHHHRADDAPPYLTIFVVGHILVPLVIYVELAMQPAFWIHALLWLPLTVAMSLAVLSPMKGAVVGLQWALYMHGFDPDGAIDDPHS